MLEPFREQTHLLAVVPKNLEQITMAPAKGKKMTAMRVVLERLLNLGSEPVKAAAHISAITRQPNPDAAWHRNHSAVRSRACGIGGKSASV
jgi:hypothetical protein